MILYISTIDKTIDLRLFNAETDLVDRLSWETNINHSEELLLQIEALLKRNKIKKADLSGLLVATGPGSYTGLRVGVTTANTLAFALNIPIVGISVENEIIGGLTKLAGSRSKGFSGSVLPVYAEPPHITKRKN